MFSYPQACFTLTGESKGSTQQELLSFQNFQLRAQHSGARTWRQYSDKSFQCSIGTTPFELLTCVKIGSENDLKVTELIHGELINEFEER